MEMGMQEGSLRLHDGRTLAWAELGDPAGFPVLAFHGTPGTHHQVTVDDAPMRATGVRFIAPDRPGYGASTYAPKRTLPEWADDVRQLADHLGLERFGVVGLSGGGPHAAVCARFLGDRVTAVAILSGIGPVAEPGTEAGMMPANRLFVRVSRRLPKLNAVPFGLLTALGRRAPDRVMAQMAKMAPAPDAAVFALPAVQAAFRRDLAGAGKTAGRAAAQDFGLMARDWGFRLEDIAVPVDVWQGDADVNVPAEHARRQAAAIPGATLHLQPGEGHFMALAHMEAVLRTLLSHGR
jgi:pimeloyl-ACP methyl ester carboxylesterase